MTRLALRSKASWGYSPAFMEACRDELTYTAEQIASDRFRVVVAEVSGRVVGFYAVEQRSPVEVELEALFVEPAWMGKGYGRALLEHAKQAAMAMGATSLVIQSDPNAADFYRAAGGVLAAWRASGSIAGRRLPVFVIDVSGNDRA